jgi:hypothetical protein
MTSKVCFKCGVDKPLSDYYKHKQMGDGHLNKCKECTKNDVNKHRADNLEKIRAYDRDRGKLPHRVNARKDYALTENGAKAIRRGQKSYTNRYPNKRKAHCKVNNAIRDGRLVKPSNCEICGAECNPHAHHWSYKECNWLDVQWVCIHCHIDIHNEQRELLRSK